AHSSAMVFGVLPRDTRQRSEITAEDKDKIFDILKKELQFSNESVVRDAAIVALGKLGSPQAVELLKTRLKPDVERDYQVRQDTLVAIGLTRSPDAAPLLIDALHSDKSPKKDWASFAMLGLGLTQDAERAAPS